MNKSSNGPCGLPKRATAIAKAMPAPSSAPRLVPVADIHPLLYYSCNLSLEKSCFESGNFAHTMSLCACRHVTGAVSNPGVAGTMIRMLFASSTV